MKQEYTDGLVCPDCIKEHCEHCECSDCSNKLIVKIKKSLPSHKFKLLKRSEVVKILDGLLINKK